MQGFKVLCELEGGVYLEVELSDLSIANISDTIVRLELLNTSAQSSRIDAQYNIRDVDIPLTSLPTAVPPPYPPPWYPAESSLKRHCRVC